MLYDEEGRAFIEPPLIPEEQHLMYIVKDYRRMYIEYGRIERRNAKLRESLDKLNKENNYLKKEVVEQRDVIRHCVKWIKKNKLELSHFLTDWLNKKLYFCENVKS